MNSTKFAVGCLVQWYEIEILPEYIDTLLEAIDNYSREKVIIDITLSINQDLEKIQEGKSIEEILETFSLQVDRIKEYVTSVSVVEKITTISDYRREFNTRYCTAVDLLVWGETDLLLPKQAFIVLEYLYRASPVPKFVATFGICKMWDDSWKVLEHPDFTDKPFIPNDYENWWSLKYTMTKEEMYEINSRTEQPEVLTLETFKFNGCGLIISSEIIKAGVNIPQSVFFVHEDTAFMLMLQKVLAGVPQYVIRNILNVHNRNHPKKRMYVHGESGESLNAKRRSNDWYLKANKFSEENCYNLFNPMYKPKTWGDVWK